MRSRHEASHPQHSKIIDVEANDPAASDASDTTPRLRPQSFRDRHALKVMGVVMAAMFATVIIAQVGC
jgi:hypothetical protein